MALRETSPAPPTAEEDAGPGGPDDSAFEALFDRYYPAAFAFFRRRGCSPQKAESLADEALLLVGRSREAVSSSPAADPWVLRVVVKAWEEELAHGAPGAPEGETPAGEGPGRPGHPPPDDLFDALLGTLRPALAEPFAKHLELCPPCAETLRDFRAFPDLAPPEGEPPLASETLRNARSRVGGRLRSATSERRQDAGERGAKRATWAVWGLVAFFLLTTVSLGIRVIHLERAAVRDAGPHAGVVVAEVPAPDPGAADGGVTHAVVPHWAEELVLVLASHEPPPQKQEAPPPRPPETPPSSTPAASPATPGAATPATAPAPSGSAGDADAPGVDHYRAAIVDDAGRTVWQGDDLQLGSDSTFTLELSRWSLSAGSYRVRVDRVDKGGAVTPVGTYAVMLDFE